MRTIHLSALKIGVLATALSLSSIASVQAVAIHDAGLFTNTLASNDDGSTALVNLGFNVNFFGSNFTSLYVNNNGNVTFNAALGTFTPFSLLSTSTPMLAPFFADVDTRNSNNVQYGQATLGGQAVFGVNWIDVGYYNSQANPLNSFQLIITDRSDIAAGDFDFEFNYDQILWETGSASGGTGGFGGNSARAGWSNGLTQSFEIAGSAINGGLLDGNATTGLINNSLNSAINGQYIFQVRNGQINGGSVPEPTAIALLALGFAGLVVMRQRKVVKSI